MTFSRTPCVLVMNTDVLLKRAFARLLTLGCDVQIVVSEAADLQELIQDICTTKPDAVLFSESIPYSRKESLSQLLMLHQMPKFIVVSEESNMLNVFSREQRLVTEVGDLLTFIN